MILGAPHALSDAIFAGPPADESARQQNEELVASFAQLFFPELPQEQARGYLALTVAQLLGAAAAEQGTPDCIDGVGSAAAENARLAAPTRRENEVISDLMRDYGWSEEEAREELEAWGGL